MRRGTRNRLQDKLTQLATCCVEQWKSAPSAKAIIIVSEHTKSISWPMFLLGAGVFLTLTFTFLMPGVSNPLAGAPLLVFWAVHIFGALILLQLAQMALMWIPSLSLQKPWVQIVLSGFIGGVLFVPLALGFDQLFGIADISDDRLESTAMRLWSELTGAVPIVMLVWVGLNATRLVQVQPIVPDQDRTEAVMPAFWARVPKEIGRDLVALSAELHYMKVHTTNGSALVLYRFGQAVQELDMQAAGQQIHRSHWVAHARVENVTRKGQGAICTTITGLELPVSRQHRRTLEAALKSAA